MAFETTKKIRFVASIDGADKVRAGLGGISSGMLDTQRAAGLARTAFAGLIGVAGVSTFVDLVTSAIDAKAKLVDLGLQTGISVEALGGLRKVALLSGTDLDVVAGASNKLSKALATNTEDSRGAAQAIKALGLNFDAFKALKADEQMLAVARAMEGFSDGTGKSSAAMLLFGKTGATLLPFMSELAERGIMASKETTAAALAAKEYEDNMVDLRIAVSETAGSLVNLMVPALNDVLRAFNASKGFWAGLGAAGSAAGDRAFDFKAVQFGKELRVLEADMVSLQREATAAGVSIGEMAQVPGIADKAREIRQLRDAFLGLTGGAAGGGRGFVNPAVLRPGVDIKPPPDGSAAAAAKKFAAEQLKIVQDAANARSAMRQAEEASILEFERSEDQRRHKEVQAARNAVQAAQFEFDTEGMLRSQIAAVTLTRLHDKQVAFTAGGENFDAVQHEIEAQRELINVLQRGEGREERRRNDPTAGANRAVKDYLKEIQQAGIATERVVGGAIRGLEDGLTDLFTGGRFDARRFVDALISEFVRLQVVQPMLAGFFSLFGFAQGAAFAPGGVQAFAQGGVVGSPTLFKFAGGAGLMGEAGPEAIMPLKRGRDGKLGVASDGGGRAIVINQYVEAGIGRGEVFTAMQLAMNSLRGEFRQVLRNAGVV